MSPPARSDGGVVGAWRHRTEGLVAVLTIDRPPRNALLFDDWRSLPGVVDDVTASGAAVVVTGSPATHFCAGNDFREFRADADFAADGTEAVQRGLRAFAESSLLSVAAIEGVALGSGFMLASLCDVRFCSADSRFGLPEMNVGAFAGYSVARTVLPIGPARRLALAGTYLSAERAEQLGYVEPVCASGDEARESALELARTWAGLADQGVLAEVSRIFGVVDRTDLWSGYTAERSLAIRTLAAGNATNRVSATGTQPGEAGSGPPGAPG